MKLWVVGQWRGDDQPWALQGVFDSEEKAVAACRDPYYFVGPEQLNVALPHDSAEWPGCYYPLRFDGEE
jgi:hypothetical protein